METKILVVDDEPQLEYLITQKFRRQIRAKEFELVFALSGLEALEKIREQTDIDLVLSDINMPGMDGLTFIAKLREINPLIKTVMVSAYGNLENIRKAMNNGAFDFVTKPIDFQDLEATIKRAIEEIESHKEAAQTKEQLNQLQELDALKTRLYTNITHEFRTPLTIILGITDRLTEELEESAQSGLHMIQRNGHHLLNLINQMLELRKLESGKALVHMQQGDMLAYLKYITASFDSYAASRDIRVHFLTEEQGIVMDYDPEKVLHIVSNLLSNAVKFTKDGGDVYVSVAIEAGENLLLKVKDTGIGIPTEKLAYIFDRFYQVDDSATRASEGTGIGLALTKELIKVLQGTIQVKSELGKGTQFTIHLPISRDAAIKEDALSHMVEEKLNAFVPPPASSFAPNLEPEVEAPLTLIIEDNPDVRQYIASCLEEEYRLTFAENGQVGIDMALDLVPDLIISDVMMPEKDGFEVCEILKNNAHTSHIPIILLTAKADVESRLKGLQRGADAYLPKPFNRDELLIRMQKLLELRRQLQQYYLSLTADDQVSLNEKDSAEAEQEHQFVKQVRAVIEAHLADPKFVVPDLCREIGMSHSQLHRKLSALTGLSTKKLIRSIRMNYAKKLLKDPQLTITAVAYDAGFNDPDYFHRVFKQVFGMTPGAFRDTI
ncbi:MAG: response regulator [Saprospiraceae bacterium]|nr:response regulator [Saprospiraceae bacterium]